MATSSWHRVAGRLLAAGLFLAGCSEPPSSSSDDDRLQQVLPQRRQTFQTDESEFVSIERVVPTLTVTGPFRPGHPIQVLAHLQANRAAKARIEVLSLDEPDSRPTTAVEPGRHHRLTRWAGALSVGASKQLRHTVTFDAPGYYRVLVVAASDPGTDTQGSHGVHVIDNSVRMLRILVDAKGGRVGEDFDSLAIADRHPQFGSYGAFLTLESAPAGAPHALAAVFSYSGHVSYFNRRVSQLQPMPDMFISFGCGWRNPTFNVIEYTYTTIRTDASGNWAGTCASDHPLMQAIGQFVNLYANVKGKDGASAAASVSGQNGGTFADMRVINDDAAATYLLLSRRIPQAFAKFGSSRGTIKVYVAQGTSNNTYGPVYNTSDVIKTNFLHTVAPEAEFATNHEYGHAFHHEAIEAYPSVNCPAPHFVAVASGLGCAFVEGFADFFGVWVGGDSLGFNPSNPGELDRTDYYIETNPYRSIGDGSTIEGAVAAFFYDLVDGTAERDNANNTGKLSESFDAVTYPGSYVAQVIRNCSLTLAQGGQYSTIFAIDQFVYCAERSLSAQSLTQYFPTDNQTYTSFTEGATEPPTWNSADIRRLWLYNLYTVGP